MAEVEKRKLRHVRMEPQNGGGVAKLIILSVVGKDVQKCPRAIAIADGWEGTVSFWLMVAFYRQSFDSDRNQTITPIGGKTFGRTSYKSSDGMTKSRFVNSPEGMKAWDEAIEYAKSFGKSLYPDAKYPYQDYDYYDNVYAVLGGVGSEDEHGKPTHFHIEILSDWKFKNDVETDYQT